VIYHHLGYHSKYSIYCQQCILTTPSFRQPAEFRLPEDIYNANEFTLQEVCAKAGGKPSTQNVNGVCRHTTDEVWFNGPRFKYFSDDPSTGNPNHRHQTLPLETARVMAYCIQRCVCSRLVLPTVPPSPPPRPWGLPDHQGLQPLEPLMCNHLGVIRLDDLRWSAQDSGDDPSGMILPYKNRDLGWLLYEKYFTIDKRNEITCGQQQLYLFNLPFVLPK
jgi:hypothetical protein